ncbi:UDP-N-acetylmuramoyl-tripeptide--D-alanyl-D-alanine ligase [Aeromicrobium sp.]|uniref:UDP-N-acetylmuramoyl-tripeptide--D-alanyl-D- alanine ligase n=1 Tax=Aeromicrobium sp. TaxID=1871063 RepID=UPI0035165270
MIPLSLAAIAQAVGGVVHGDGDVVVTGPATLDSRAVTPGGLFVALAGERVDGHDFVGAALQGGAVAVLASRPVEAPAVVVDDVTDALGRLARHVLDLLDVQVVALTGSQGKTSVKDLLAHLLGRVGPTVATAGNYNNELGVPLTVLRADLATRYLVVEMGARGIGHVARLCRVAPPHVSTVLNVGSAHVGEFGSVDNIAIGKGEIVEGLRPGGTAVLNADDVRVDAMEPRVPAGCEVVRFGRAAQGPDDVRIVDVTLDARGEPDVVLEHGAERWTTHVPLLGVHQASNAAAALALLSGLGLPVAGTSLEDYAPATAQRLERHERADGVVVLDDSYNANPESVRAALEALAGLGAQRRVAVLGEMLELGADAHARHVEVGQAAAELGTSLVVAVGDGARGIAEGAGDVGLAVPDVDVALDTLRAWLSPGDAVLVKASRGARLERVTTRLLEP